MAPIWDSKALLVRTIFKPPPLPRSLLVRKEYREIKMDPTRFKINDWVICTREKHGLSPGKRAKNISPSPHGELYSYEVDKYWIVRDKTDSQLVLETRTGKRHVVAADDRRLRAPNFFEKWWFKSRFPAKNPPSASTGSTANSASLPPHLPRSA